MVPCTTQEPSRSTISPTTLILQMQRRRRRGRMYSKILPRTHQQCPAPRKNQVVPSSTVVQEVPIPRCKQHTTASVSLCKKLTAYCASFFGANRFQVYLVDSSTRDEQTRWLSLRVLDTTDEGLRCSCCAGMPFFTIGVFHNM